VCAEANHGPAHSFLGVTKQCFALPPASSLAQRQRTLTDSTVAFEMERMFGIAVRDGADLFLWIRLRRAARTDIYYVLPTGRENDLEWKKWNPHGSWHRDGRLHHKSFDQKIFPAERQKPNAKFKGTYNLITRGIASDEPRAFGVCCDPTKFSEIMEIPAGILSPKHYETHTSIDVSEPGLKPLLMSGAEQILLQRIFDDAIPHITVTVYRWPVSSS
jgi:hypothetical protein